MKFGFSESEIKSWNEFYRLAVLLTIEGLEIEENLNKVNVLLVSNSESKNISSYYSKLQFKYDEIFNITIDESEREKEEKLIYENLQRIQKAFELSEEI